MNPIKTNQYKEYRSDPYVQKKRYTKVKSQQIDIEGKNYTLIDYKKSHGWKWQIREGIIALGLTLLTGFVGLASKKIRAHWIQAGTGESTKKIKIPLAIAVSQKADDVSKTGDIVPKTAEFAYRGSNAEYLILNKEGQPCSLEEYKISLESTSLRFPRMQDQKIETETLHQLQQNEAQEIETRIQNAGLTAVKIPKSLYDLFYWRFYMEDMVHLKVRTEDTEKIKQVAQEKFALGKAKSSYPTIKKLRRVYAYTNKGEGKIAIFAPKIDLDLSGKSGPFAPIIAKRYYKQEKAEDYQIMTHRLNERILDYLKKNEIELMALNWESMHKVTVNLLKDIEDSIEDDIWNKNDIYGVLGRPIDFARKFTKYKNRINEFILGAIWHEYKAPPNVYTVYRGADLNKDLQESSNPFSFSFGHSAFGGLQFDGESGSPISFSDRTLYALDIDIEDYEKDGDTARVIFIPPARGPNRIVEWGEVGHVRTKVAHMKDNAIYGFTTGGFLGVEKRDLEFLVTPVETPAEVKEHIKATRVFFNNVHHVIVE